MKRGEDRGDGRRMICGRGVDSKNLACAVLVRKEQEAGVGRGRDKEEEGKAKRQESGGERMRADAG